MNAEEILRCNLAEFAAATAAKQPTPGGGSVAGAVGALAVSLGEMTLNFSRGKKSLAGYDELHAHLAGRLERARRMFLDLLADDVAAFGMYEEATRQEPGEEKAEAEALALAAAIDVPREMAKLALAVLGDLLQLTGASNAWLASDLVAAAHLASAVCVLSDLNVRVNAKNLDDATAACDLKTASTNDRRKAASLAEQIEASLARHLD